MGGGGKRHSGRQGGGSNFGTKKGRTTENFFCPYCGYRYRPYNRRCLSQKCEMLLYMTRKCGNCHMPRERPEYKFCRLCGLSYEEVGLIETVKTGEAITASTRPPVTTVSNSQ